MKLIIKLSYSTSAKFCFRSMPLISDSEAPFLDWNPSTSSKKEIGDSSFKKRLLATVLIKEYDTWERFFIHSSSLISQTSLIPFLKSLNTGQESIMMLRRTLIQLWGSGSRAKPAPNNRMDKLDTVFSCPFCNHGSSVECRIDMKNLIGEASCGICQDSISTTVTEPIDIYSEWIDDCERVNTYEDDVAE